MLLSNIQGDSNKGTSHIEKMNLFITAVNDFSAGLGSCCVFLLVILVMLISNLIIFISFLLLNESDGIMFDGVYINPNCNVHVYLFKAMIII